MSHFTTSLKKKKTKFDATPQFWIRVAFSLLVCVLMILLATFPEKVMKSFLDGLMLFSTAVLPALFPFLFFSKTLTDLGLVSLLATKLNKPFHAIFGVPGIGAYVFLMSAICGYPVGAKILSDLVLNGTIDTKTAHKLLPFCSTSGPLFVIGSVGVGMFANKTLGLLVFAIHLASALLCALILRPFYSKDKDEEPTKQPVSSFKPLDQILSKSMTDSCSAILIVGGFIALFYLLIDILTDFGVLTPIKAIFYLIFQKIGIAPELSIGISTGMVEMTRGCRDLSLTGASISTLLPALSALISFSGLSILMQSMAFLSQAKIKLSKFFGVKLLHTFLSVVLATLIALAF